MDTKIQYWAITGRLLGDDEDSGELHGPSTQREALDAFIASQLGDRSEEQLLELCQQFGCSTEFLVEVNCVFGSDTPISSF